MRLTISTTVNEGVCAEVRLVHVDERATPVDYAVWRRVTVKPDRPVTLDVPEHAEITARAAVPDRRRTAPLAVHAGGVYRINGSASAVTLSLHAVHPMVLRRQAGVLNETDFDAELALAVGDATAWYARVGALHYGIFDLSLAYELTFLDAAGHVISRSLYVPPDGVEEAELCCRRVPSTGRLYADAVPASPHPAAVRRGSASQVTFRVRGRHLHDAQLAVFLVPRDRHRLLLVPWQTFDLHAPRRFSFDCEARTISAVLADGRRAEPRLLLPGQVHALVEGAAGEVSLVADGDAWIDAVAARVDNHTAQPAEARLANGGHAYAIGEVDAADGPVPSSALFDSGPPSLAFLVAHPSLLRERFRAADLAALTSLTPMPAPGTDAFVVVDGTCVRITPDRSKKEQ